MLFRSLRFPGRYRGRCVVKLTSRDRSMTLAIAAPGVGLALTLDGHLWLFDRDGNITGSIPPPTGHLTVRSPESCPGCVVFVVLNHGTQEV